MSTIRGYDRPILDLIDELNDTGHVTHTSYKKKSVTFHHNAGRLSHYGVLRVWQYRPASAQFNFDAEGTIAQYVKTLEYAWACGNTYGNQTSIHLEMCNETLGPDWKVGEKTWKAAARFAGFLFAKVIKERPGKDNVFFHHHWYGTSCAGPYMDSIYDELLAEVKKWYAYFTNGSGSIIPGSPNIPLLVVDGAFGEKSVYATSWVLAEHGYRVSLGGDPTGQINRYYTESIQKALNAAGKRDRYGRRLVEDGLGIGYNIGKRYPRAGWTRTITAIQMGFGSSRSAADGFFSPNDSWTVRKIQNDANNGARDIPFFAG